MRRLALLVLVTVAAPSAARAGGPPEIVLDRDDIDVTESVVVKPGVYRVADLHGDGVLRVKAPGVTVVLEGVTLDGAKEGQEPDAFDGVGVVVEKAEGVTIRGGSVRGFRVGVKGRDSPRLTVERLDASGNRKQRLKSTPEREDPSDWLWPHENDDGQWERTYGAGISLTRCPRSTVASCRVRGGQNGLLLTRCDDSVARRSSFSFNSGWGIAMYRSSRCKVLSNRCDWCVRGYSHGVYARGQDSAGILVFEQCSDNLFRGNSATHSGDGFFLYAGNETLKETGEGGCNRNEVVRNDFSHAVANAIEATFSDQNSFSENRLDDSDHGVWAGYSRRTSIVRNQIHSCSNGISIEHGTDNVITRNRIVDAGVGVHLWWDEDRDLLDTPYGRTQDTSSARNALHGNSIEARVALRLAADADSFVRHNRLTGSEKSIELLGRTRVHVSENLLRGREAEAPVIEASKESSATFERNSSPVSPVFRGAGSIGVLLGESRLLDEREDATLSFDGGAFLEPALPRGRRYILVDEWGPIDPTRRTVFPKTQSAVGAALVHVLGAGVAWRVAGLSDDFVAEPSEGKAPSTFRIRPKPDAELPTYAPFEAKIRMGDTDFLAMGTVLSSRWKVRWHVWTTDPREDAAAFAALVASAPKATTETDGLDFAWGGGKPHDLVPADRFVTVATTTLVLPAGRWRMKTLSDDGVRVRIDGKVVLEDWTWHAPKEDAAAVELTEGAHEVVVEHFELDGHAALRFGIEPVR
jgi:parallel beta-helix repeat protein